jgi:hypothetical protein
VNAGRSRANATHRGQGCNAHDTEEWPRDRYHDSGRDRRGFRLAINQDDALEEAREFVRQRARIGALGVEPVGDGEVDLANAHLQDVAPRRAIDEDRPGLVCADPGPGQSSRRMVRERQVL